MPNFYDDSKFGVISRKWFGLTKKWGGDVANGYSLNAVTHGATSVTHLAKWYPRGPIRITKAGSFCLATLTNASSDLHKARLKTRGASASMGVLWYIKSTSTAPAPAAFASNVPNFTAKGTASVTYPTVKAGEYITIVTATPVTDKGTRVQATTTGTIAFFADYVAKFDSSGKWDA
jgi:hypothetical protein